jgi:DNA polymerase-3 subunit gamma/tau
MAHRTLALKYRPQVFTDLIGQDHVSVVLSRALEGGRVANAYLFTGARGVGKTTSARILAKSLNCERRRSGEVKGADPCNQCTSCTEITSGVSLDVAEIDGASNRGIADVQALREKVRFSPTGGSYRVVIIDEVHQLSGDAFAALLKTLEEPPPHVVFVFATTDPQKLPDTIRSRCQRFDFARVPLRKVADRLLAIAAREAKDPEGVRFKLTEGAALLIAHKSEGSVRDAVSALDQVVSAGEPEVSDEVVRRVLGIADREAFFTLAGAILERDPVAALHALHRAFEKGLDARDLADGLSEHIRHVLVLKVDPEGGDLVALAEEDLRRLKAQGERWSESDLLRLLKLASEASWPMRDSPQPLVHLEAAVLQMATLEPGETLARLLARIEALDRRIGGEPSGGAAGGSAPGGARAGAARAPVPAGAGRSASAPGASSAAPSAALRPGAFAGPAPVRLAPSASAPPPAMSRAPGAAPVAGAGATLAGARAATAAPAAVAELECERDEAIEECWRETVRGVNGSKRMLGAFLEESLFMGVAGEWLVLAMDDLHRTVVEEKENRALLAAEVARAFGRPLALRCVPPGREAPARPTVADMRPLVDQAIAWFQGDVIERGARGSERTGE